MGAAEKSCGFLLLILTQSDKRTKFDKEVELAEDGNIPRLFVIP